MKANLPRLKGGLTPLIVVAVLLALFPLMGVPNSWLLYLFLFFIYLALANMWNLLAGYSGLLSLGQPGRSFAGESVTAGLHEPRSRGARTFLVPVLQRTLRADPD